MSTDKTFETKFSQLVETEINRKLPSLMPYRVGFELLDKDEDGEHAGGIMAFLINGSMVFCPAVFHKGSLKGFNILVLEKKDLFLPALDSWITQLKQPDDKADVTGLLKSTKRSTDISPGEALIEDPEQNITKYAADSLAQQGLMERWLELPAPDSLTLPALPVLLSMLGKEACQVFFNTFSTNADFANAVLRHYSASDFDQLATDLNKEAASLGDGPAKTESVVIYSGMKDKGVSGLKDSEKKQLVENGMFVKDERKEKSSLFRSQMQKGVLITPTMPGIYDLLMADGSFQRFLVLVPTQQAEQNLPTKCQDERNELPGRELILIPDDKPTRFFKRSSSGLLGRVVSDPQVLQTYKKPFGSEALRRSLTDLLSGGGNHRFMVTQGGTRTLSVRPDIVYKDDKRQIRLDNCEVTDLNTSAEKQTKSAVLQFSDKAGKLGIYGQMLLIPPDARIFVEMDYNDDKDYRFGSEETVRSLIYKEAGCRPLRILSGPGSFTIQSAHEKNAEFNDRIAALKHLILREGIDGGQAQLILKEASRTRSCQYLIKYAALYNPDRTDRPAVREEQAVISTQTRAVVPETFVQSAIKASENGTRAVLDSRVLRGVMKASDPVSVRREVIVKMMAGMDAAGRLLFRMYWKPEEFEERYGKDKFKELEDKISQVFQETGDLVIFLKEQAQDVTDTPENLVGSLSEDIGTAEKG